MAKNPHPRLLGSSLAKKAAPKTAEYTETTPVCYDDNGRGKLAGMPGYGAAGRFVPMPELMRGKGLDL